MGQNNDDQKRIPIRTRVMRIVLLTTLVSLLAASITGVFCIRWIRKSTEKAMTEQFEGNLKNIVRAKANSADAKFEHYEKYIVLIADYIEGMYKNKEQMIEQGHIYYPPADSKEYAMTRCFVSKDADAADYTEEMLFYSNLQEIWEPIALENKDLISTVYAGSKSGMLTSYDRWSYLSVPEDGGELIYDYTEADWYRQGLEADGVFYTGLYIDSQGRGLTITVASPYRDENGNVMGVECADYDITGLYNDMISIDLGNGARSFALDSDGAVISPDAEGKSSEELTGLSSKEIKELLSDEDGILEKGDFVYVSVPIERIGWTLCSCVPRDFIRAGIHEADDSIRLAYIVFIAFAAGIILLALLAVNRAAASITHPMELLGKDMKRISEGDLQYRAPVYRNDEIGDITKGLNDMLDTLNTTKEELVTTQQHADAMNRLATLDSLTGIRNKTAFDDKMSSLKQEIDEGSARFGIVMIDLNNLKDINDSCGHDKGDISIRRLCELICNVFSHSPVFRVGGDEFVAVLKNRDYDNADKLISSFREKMSAIRSDQSLEPWERIEAACGYARYDASTDHTPDDVLVRADGEMYKNKRMMKRSEKEQ